MQNFTTNAVLGKYSTIAFGLTLFLDIVLSVIGLTTPWLFVPIGIIELTCVMLIGYSFFASLQDFFTMSLVGLSVGTIRLDGQQQGVAS